MSLCPTKLLACLAFVLTVSAQGGSRPFPPYVGLPTADGLTRLFFNSRSTRQDPQNSLACFSGYIGESNQIAERYSKCYSGCLSDAQNERKSADRQFSDKRKWIERSGENICNSLKICKKISNTLDAFNCHSTTGSNNTIAAYAISSNASESASLLQEQYRIADLHHEQCMKSAERSYVSSTAENYNYLQACLEGRVKPKVIPAPTTTTSTTTTTTTTTEAPTTTEVPLASTESPIQLEDQFKKLLNLLN